MEIGTKLGKAGHIAEVAVRLGVGVGLSISGIQGTSEHGEEAIRSRDVAYPPVPVGVLTSSRRYVSEFQLKAGNLTPQTDFEALARITGDPALEAAVKILATAEKRDGAYWESMLKDETKLGPWPFNRTLKNLAVGTAGLALLFGLVASLRRRFTSRP